VRVAIAIAVAVVAAAPATAAARGCRDSSTTIGISKCHHYGTWDPGFPLALELDLFERSVDLGHVDTIADSIHYVGELGRVHATGAMLRFYASLSRHVYVGLLVTAARSADLPPVAYENPNAGVGFTSNIGAVIYDGALVGVRAAIGRLQLGAELSPELVIGTPAGSETVGELNARLSADVWLTSTVTIGARLGVDVIAPGDRTVGLGVGVHFAAFDGAR